jgi:hypothetical protein
VQSCTACEAFRLFRLQFSPHFGTCCISCFFETPSSEQDPCRMTRCMLVAVFSVHGPSSVTEACGTCCQDVRLLRIMSRFKHGGISSLWHRRQLGGNRCAQSVSLHVCPAVCAGSRNLAGQTAAHVLSPYCTAVHAYDYAVHTMHGACMVPRWTKPKKGEPAGKSHENPQKQKCN